MLLGQVIPVRLEFSDGQSSAWRWVPFLFLGAAVSLGYAQGPSPAAPVGQGAHPHSEDCAVLGKMLLALLMCIWGRKKV